MRTLIGKRPSWLALPLLALSLTGALAAHAANAAPATRCSCCQADALRPAEPQTSPLTRGGDIALGSGSWSYFGDPRALSIDGSLFTGWISPTGEVWVARVDAAGRTTARAIFTGHEVDDHDNPTLVEGPQGRLIVFFSGHCGFRPPTPGVARLIRYRIATTPASIERWGPVHTVRTNVPGRLGTTYPNAVTQRGKLWLFWRGGRWTPTFSWSRDGLHWVRARELARSASGQRPYAKYVGDGDQRIHVVLSDGHPRDQPGALHYARIERRRLWTAGGRRIGSFDDLPLRTRELEPLFSNPTPATRAWPMDIAIDAAGHPVVVYTQRRTRESGDTFFYARFDGVRWRTHRVVDAGAGRGNFNSGGATLDHADPRLVYLSRTVGAWNQVEAWFTPDLGATWRSAPLTSSPVSYAIRPIRPRGEHGSSARLLYVSGDERTTSFRSFFTTVRLADISQVRAELVGAN